MAEITEDEAFSTKLMRSSSGSPDATKQAARSDVGAGPALAPTPAFLRGAAPLADNTAVPPRSTANRFPASTPNGIEPRTLIVGKGITLSGEITSCDRLVVDGSVRANLQNCKHMTVSESGLFDGNALIDDAEVHGRFEGDLCVRNRLAIRATGHVSGSISYRQIEIEVGGKISGSIQIGET